MSYWSFSLSWAGRYRKGFGGFQTFFKTLKLK